MEQERRSLLSAGFVRKYCKDSDTNTTPDDIIELLTLWFSFQNQFDADLSDANIEILTITNDKYGEYQQVKIKEDDYQMATAICFNVIQKGYKGIWRFQPRGDLIILGIIDNETAKATDHYISDFSVRL